MTVADLGELGLLARIRERLTSSRPTPDVPTGIGDDAAVLALDRGTHLVATTDALVEGVHFDRALSSPEDIGFRALAVNLSDLAAMGAKARWALLSLIVPPTTDVGVIDGIVEGLDALAGTAGISVVGGNLTRTSGPLVIDVTAFGAVHPRRTLLRSGGRPGDALYVSGPLGAAAAGLGMLSAGTASDDAGAAACIARYRRPEPRLRLGYAVAAARAARAAIDSSDGLAVAAAQLAEASGCGVEIDASALPIAPAAHAWWLSRGADPVHEALTGGDDYELLFAVPTRSAGRLRHARSRVTEPALTRVGVLTAARGAWLLHDDGSRQPLPGGFAHFHTPEQAG